MGVEVREEDELIHSEYGEKEEEEVMACWEVDQEVPSDCLESFVCMPSLSFPNQF